MMTKQELRQVVKKRKAQLTLADQLEQAVRAFDRVTETPVWQKARNILIYWSLPDELPTHGVIKQWLQQGKQIYLPRVDGELLQVVKYNGGNLDNNNRFHIGEPVGDAVNPSCLDLVIVPAVALDSHRNRLGRGKGYYDRLLANIPNCPTIGVAMDEQLVDAVPVEAHDRRLDCVVTASKLVADVKKRKLFAAK